LFEGFMKQCVRCQQFKEDSDYPITTHIKKDGSSGVRAYCNDCNSAYRAKMYLVHKSKIRSKAKQRYAEDPEYRDRCRHHALKQNYGITLLEFNLLRETQDYSCGICKKHESKLARKRLYVDHNHKTGSVRGLLCNLCNVGLGAFFEDDRILWNALTYLKTKNKI
jgi:Recombination endonuclease VII